MNALTAVEFAINELCTEHDPKLRCALDKLQSVRGDLLAKEQWDGCKAWPPAPPHARVDDAPVLAELVVAACYFVGEKVVAAAKAVGRLVTRGTWRRS